MIAGLWQRLRDYEKGEQQQGQYRSFTGSELRELSLGTRPHLDSLPDQGAQDRATGTLKSLMSESVPGPAPWIKLHADLARWRGIEWVKAESSVATPET